MRQLILNATGPYKFINGVHQIIALSLYRVFISRRGLAYCATNALCKPLVLKPHPLPNTTFTCNSKTAISISKKEK